MHSPIFLGVINVSRNESQRPTQSRPHPLRNIESQSANSPSNPYVGLNEGFLLILATICNYNNMLEMVFGIHPIRHFSLSLNFIISCRDLFIPCFYRIILDHLYIKELEPLFFPMRHPFAFKTQRNTCGIFF